MCVCLRPHVCVGAHGHIHTHMGILKVRKQEVGIILVTSVNAQTYRLNII